MIGKTNSQGVVPKGTINITENGTYSIAPYSEAIVSVSGLVPSGTLEISSNGIYDVTTYASASVNVQGGGGENTLASLMTFTLESYVGPLQYSSDYNNYTVPSYLFQMQKKLKTFTVSPISVNAADSRIVVGYSAFQFCSSLEECNFLSRTKDDNNKYISGVYRDNAFIGCSKLSTPVLNITYLGQNTFKSCYLLSKVRLAELSNLSIIIDNQAFAFCSNLSDAFFSARQITVSNSAFAETPITHLSSIFSADLPIIANTYAFADMRELLEASISLLSFNAEGLFYKCSKLTTVSITNSSICKQIPMYCFYNNQQLSSIYIASVSTSLSVGQYAYYQCYNLKQVPHPSNIKKIGQYGFLFAGIKSFVTSQVHLAGRNIFGYSQFLYFSANVTSMASRVFENCWSLSYVNLGNFSGVVQSSTFYACSNLKSMLFSKLGEANNFYNNCFLNCSSLESLYLFGSVVTKLSTTNAFAATPLSISNFLGHFGSIYVPESLYATYIATTNWVTYSSRFVSLTNAEMEQIITDYNNVSYVEE